MKKIFIWCVCLLIIVTIVPMAAGIDKTKETDRVFAETEKTEKKTETSESTENSTEMSENSDDETEQVVSLALKYIHEDMSDDGALAILAICKNNYLYCKEQNLSPDSVDISGYSDELFDKLRVIYRASDIEIKLRGERVYIPITKLSGGITSTSDEYPYILGVASPWDVLEPEFDARADYPCGVSVKGIEHLCSEGSSGIEALTWYLPNFEITGKSS